jgi:hypothetical protein
LQISLPFSHADAITYRATPGGDLFSKLHTPVIAALLLTAGAALHNPKL